MKHLFQSRKVALFICVLLVSFSVIVALSSAGRPAGSNVALAAPMNQTTPVINFVSTNVSAAENRATGFAQIFVQMTGTSLVPVTVQYLTIPGTATNNVDYTGVSNVLTFTVSLVSPQTQSFNVPLINDVIDEPDETVNLVLRNPVGAVLGVDSTAVLTILDDDPPPTATPTATSGAPPVFVDAYEPNNTSAQAYEALANAADLCNATLWPIGDEDYFKFWARSGSYYQVYTTNLKPGLDTVLTVYNPQGAIRAVNDDRQPGDRSSLVSFTAGSSGFFVARIVNQDPSDPANKTYCFGVKEIVPPTPTVTPTFVPPIGDACEFNSTFQTACLIGAGETKSLNFVPSYGSPQDTDVFRLWMKPGILYTCETLNLSSVNDTNIILFDNNGNAFNPPIGNDDKAPGDLGSKVSYRATYTGWLYIMVGPVNPPPFAEAALYTYDLTCTAEAATPTPTRAPVVVPPPGSGSGVPTATPTAIVFPTFPPTPTPIDFSLFATPQPQAPPVVQFLPLATATPLSGGARTSSVNVTLYYDANRNFTPELSEGIVDVAVALYDNTTGQLLQFGHTNEAGVLNFSSITAAGAVRIEVPFLNYSQIVVGTNSNILLRIAPRPLPANIP